MFEAIAMANLIVATAVFDLAGILEGCGITVDPDDVQVQSSAIERVITHQDEAIEKGKCARPRCLERFIWDVMSRVLFPIFSQFDHASPGSFPDIE